MTNRIMLPQQCFTENKWRQRPLRQTRGSTPSLFWSAADASFACRIKIPGLGGRNVQAHGKFIVVQRPVAADPLDKLEHVHCWHRTSGPTLAGAGVRIK